MGINKDEIKELLGEELYEKLSDEDRSLMPLVPVYFLAKSD